MQACSGTERAYNPRDGRWTQTLILTQIMMMMMVLGCARSDAVDQRRGSRGVEACDSCGDDNNVVAVLDLTTAKVQFDGVRALCPRLWTVTSMYASARIVTTNTPHSCSGSVCVCEAGAAATNAATS